MKSTTQIGSGRPLFVLPGDRFINADKPLSRLSDLNANNPVKEPEDEPVVSNRLGTSCGGGKDEPESLPVSGLEPEPALVALPKVGFGG